MYKLLFGVALLGGMLGAFAGPAPALVYEGVNGYPSGSRFRIEVYVDADGYVSAIKGFDSSGVLDYRADFVVSGDRVTGRYENDEQRTVSDIALSKTDIEITRKVFDKATKTLARTDYSSILIAPTEGVLFQTDERSFQSSPSYDLVVIDRLTDEPIYKFYRNTAFNEGWYKSDWKTVGDATTIREYFTMERYANAWIDRGHGTLIGRPFVGVDPWKRIVNYCLISELYPDAVLFIPCTLGLKTGSY